MVNRRSSLITASKTKEDDVVTTEKDVRCEDAPSNFAVVHTRDGCDPTEEIMKPRLVSKGLETTWFRICCSKSGTGFAAVSDEVHGQATVVGMGWSRKLWYTAGETDAALS